ncbi:MAG: protein kinase [Oscillochloris sp.]|nr:protein kinase [Oscillochloris sp.]
MPGGVTVAPSILALDMPVMVAVAVVCLPVFFNGMAVFRWEGGLLRRLHHPALPQLYGGANTPSEAWLARDLVPGTPLLALARQAAQSPANVLAWAAQICDLLTYLHTRPVPVVCGDIKPANLILRPDGGVVLIDLGASQTLTRRPPRPPRPRHGTPGYAAPEQLAARCYDERSDIFSLAVTCYELLTGFDPTQAPLQFELAQLDRAAPRLAPGLRAGMELDLERRCPTAAALRARLGAPVAAPPLLLEMGVSVTDLRGLNALILRHPQLLAPAIATGALEEWLTRHPDATMGKLRYDLRSVRREAVPRAQPLDILLSAMAPPEGSPLVQASPAQLDLGDIPLKSWRVWGRPTTLTLHNSALTPLRWELEIPAQAGVDLRVLAAGRLQRQTAGVLATGARVGLELVAQGSAGPQQGALTLRSGQYQTSIPWRATARVGLPVGGQYAARLEDLDPTRPDLVSALEALLCDGSLVRWLRASGKRPLASELEQTLKQRPDESARRLLVARVLHSVAPAYFPLLRLHGLEQAASHPLAAGQFAHLIVEVENLSPQTYPALVASHCGWARAALASSQLLPFGSLRITLQLSPPDSLQGQQHVALTLSVGNLELPLLLNVKIERQRWWQRIGRLFGG